MIDLSLSVVVLEIQPLHPWQTTLWKWKASRNVKSGRMWIEGTESSMELARQAASAQLAVLAGFNPESAGVE